MDDRQITLETGLKNPKDLENLENLKENKAGRQVLRAFATDLLGPTELARRQRHILYGLPLGILLGGIGYSIVQIASDENGRRVGAFGIFCGAAVVLIAILGLWLLRSKQAFRLRMHHTELRCVAIEMDEELRVLEDLVLQIAESNDPAAAQKRLQNAILLRKRRRAT